VRTAAQRFGLAALVSVIILAATGAANAYTRLDTVDQLVTTDYGRVTSAKILLLVVLVLIAAAIRRRLLPDLDGEKQRAAFLKILALEISLIVIAFGLGVALAVSPYPRVDSLLPTYGESLLGSLYPEAPTAASVIFGFQLEPLFSTQNSSHLFGKQGTESRGLGIEFSQSDRPVVVLEGICFDGRSRRGFSLAGSSGVVEHVDLL
jgi:hypothetical protein